MCSRVSMGNILQHPNMVTLVQRTPQLISSENTIITRYVKLIPPVFPRVVNWRFYLSNYPTQYIYNQIKASNGKNLILKLINRQQASLKQPYMRPFMVAIFISLCFIGKIIVALDSLCLKTYKTTFHSCFYLI